MVLRNLSIACLLITVLTWSSVIAIETNNAATFSGMFNMIKTRMGYAQELKDDQPDIYDEIDTYITSFLDGAGIPKIISNTTQCVNATRDLAKGMDSSIRNIINTGVSLDSYLQVTQSIGQAQPMIKTCFEPSVDTYKQTADHLSHFRDTKNFFEKMGLKVAYSFFDWYSLYFSLNSAIEEKDMKKIVYYAGKFTNILLSFDTSLNGTFSEEGLYSSSEPNSFGTFTFDLVYSFLDGAMILGSDQIDNCGGNVTGFVHNYDYAIEEFKKHTEEGLQNGVYAIADNFGVFHNVNEICVGGFNAALQKAQEYLVIKTAPLEIIYNIVWNYRKVYKHMTQAIECSFSMDAKCIGYNGGSLLYQIFAKHK